LRYLSHYYAPEFAGFDALAATDALFGINYRSKAVKGYSAAFARFFAHTAAHAADGARLALDGAFLRVGAEDCGSSLFGYYRNNLFGAGIGALAATYADALINLGNAVFYRNSAEFTRINAVAVAYTAKGARLVAAKERGGGFAALKAAVIKHALVAFEVSAAGDERTFCLGFRRFGAENLSYLRRDLRAAYDAEISLDLACRECFGIALAARERAGTAVGTREDCDDFFGCFVALDSHYYVSDAEAHACDNRYAAYQEYGE